MAEQGSTNYQQAHTGTRYEFRQLLHLGLPVMGTQIAQMGIGITDSIMAGRLSAVDLAGVALGSNILWPSLMIFWGLLMAVAPITSHLKGARRVPEIGVMGRQALWLAGMSSVPVILVITNAQVILVWLQADPAMVAITTSYLQAIAWGMPGVLGYFALRYMAEGMGYTRPSFIIAMSALCLNVPLNYIFMYGEFGLPALGGVGCGVASAILMWFECLAMLFVVTRRRFQSYGLFSAFSWPQPKRLYQLIALGLPIGMTSFLEVAVFSVVPLLIAQLGVNAVGSHQIAMNTAGLAFMLPMALGHAASIRIAFNVGAGILEQARHTLRIALGMAVTIGAISGLTIFAGRDLIAALYTKEPAVTVLAAQLMLFAAAFQVFDCSQAVAIGALRGYKETRFPMLVNLIAYWLLALPLGYYLTYEFNSGQLGVRGFWLGLTLSIILVAAAVIGKLLRLSNQPEKITALAKG